MTEALSAERILDAAEEVLRRYGPQKTTVVDVARALDVSHGTVYRHYPSKAALRDAVVARWLHRLTEPLERIASAADPAPERLRAWLAALAEAKREKMRADPEMFAAYSALAEEARAVVGAHVAALVGQIERILRDGVAAGAFRLADPAAAARAVFVATGRFHHPAHRADWADPGIEAQFRAVVDLVLAGLTAGPPTR